MSVFDEIDWDEVRQHYDERVETHERLLKLHDGGLRKEFFRLALGIERSSGNYSAAEHAIGPRVAAENPKHEERVFNLATELRAVTNGRTVPRTVRAAGLRYVAVGVGSELSCMVNPQVCWVANTRTIWTHLVVKHADNVALADEELDLYRDGDASSEMAYAKWAAIHRELDTAMTRIADLGTTKASAADVEPGDIKYLWADAIANYLYAAHH